MSTAKSPNASIIEAWNTILFDKFRRYEHLVIEGLGRHGSELFDRFPPRAGSRILDLGCGFGDTTVRLAELLGSGGSGRCSSSRRWWRCATSGAR